jgi:acyl-CoA dehydrogenase
VAGEPVDVLTCKRDPPPSIPLDGDVIDELRSRAALASVLLMAGTAERVLDLVIAHATARAQFGRPISRFQAVQHMISDAAAEVSLIDVAADAAVCAVEELGWGHPRTRFAIAAAVSGAGHAVDPVVRNAHQVLGAIGCAREHPLHRYTNRLLARRSENGSVRSWDMAVLRSAVHQAGSPGLWPWLVDGAGPGGTRRP